MAGVMQGFAVHVSGDAHLTLAGPSVEGVADDPEGAEVLTECRQLWESLPADVRARVHLASLPMDDVEENAAMVNALQRHAAVVVQKSLVEGFGLTVAEAMWKERPVVASRVGGIQDQVEDGATGILVDDPRDLPAFARAIEEVLGDRGRCSEMGEAGRERVRDNYLAVDRLREYVGLLTTLIGRR